MVARGCPQKCRSETEAPVERPVYSPKGSMRPCDPATPSLRVLLAALAGCSLLTCRTSRPDSDGGLVREEARADEALTRDEKAPAQDPDRGATTSENGCTMIGCGPNFRGTLCLRAAISQIRAGTMTLCRNGRCSSGPLAPLVREALPSFMHTSLPPPLSVQLSLVKDDDSSAQYTLEMSGNWRDSDLKDGDVYDVSIRSADGRPILRTRRSLTSETTFPNGPVCGPACRSFVIGHSCFE